jgi:hypothetical protein
MALVVFLKGINVGGPRTLAGRRWLGRVLAREGRLVLGVYRREMRTIGQLGVMDRPFGVPVVTRNWNSIASVKVLEAGRS